MSGASSARRPGGVVPPRRRWIFAALIAVAAFLLARRARHPERPRPRAAPSPPVRAPPALFDASPQELPLVDATVRDARSHPARAPLRRPRDAAFDRGSAPVVDATPPRVTQVTIRSIPFGYLRVDDGPERPSPIPWGTIAPGTHHLRVRYPSLGGATGDVDFELRPGERREISITPRDLH